MSCLRALGSQIITFISVPHEVLSLQHKVFQEYAKIALGPDFSHTFPSFVLIAAVCILLRRNLSFKWLPITNRASIRIILQLLFSWIIINAVLWYWLIFQRILYCSVWTYWNKDFGIQENFFPWWRKVWSSFYPPSSQPPVLSASLISWLLSMMLTSVVLWCSIYTDRVTSSFSRVSVNIQKSLIVLKTYRIPSFTRLKRGASRDSGEEIEATEKSEMGSMCDECRSEVSTDIGHHNTMIQREISPISYGTNWTPRPNFSNKKPQREFSCRTVVGVTECRETEDNCLPRQLRNRRGCHTVIPSSSSDKSNDC